MSENHRHRQDQGQGKKGVEGGIPESLEVSGILHELTVVMQPNKDPLTHQGVGMQTEPEAADQGNQPEENEQKEKGA